MVGNNIQLLPQITVKVNDLGSSNDIISCGITWVCVMKKNLSYLYLWELVTVCLLHDLCNWSLLVFFVIATAQAYIELCLLHCQCSVRYQIYSGCKGIFSGLIYPFEKFILQSWHSPWLYCIICTHLKRPAALCMTLVPVDVLQVWEITTVFSLCSGKL